MAWRLLPKHGLRARLILLSVAPSLLCLVASVSAVAWFVQDVHREVAGRLLLQAGSRIEERLEGVRARLDGLAERPPGGTTLDRLLTLDGEARAAGLRDLLAAARTLDPLVSAAELRSGGAGLPEGVERAGDDCGRAGCPPGLWGRATSRPAGGGIAELRLGIRLDDRLAAALAAGEAGEIVPLADGHPRPGRTALPAGPLSGWAPAWLAAASGEGRTATGTVTLDGHDWLAMTLPLHGDGPPASLLLLLPELDGALDVDEMVGVALPVLAVILVLGTILAAGAARRLGGMLTGLTEALRRLGRGDLAVPIPPPPRGAPREVAELTEACILFRDASAERGRLSERLRWLANFDGLTGLPNRALLGDRLDLALASARREGAGLTVLAMDLDRFKEVNDALGHAAGDEVLRVVAARLRACLRATDTLARIGGDEFVLVAPDLRHPEALATFSSRLLAAAEEPIALGAEFRTVGLSIGAAILAPDALEGRSEALLQDADLALYQAKAAGGGCLRVFQPEMDERLRTRRALVTDLRGAVARQELVILFQPQVSTATRRIMGAEALLRWHHPQRGMIAPDVFIPLAEETGLIVPIGAWVLEQACQVARGWGDLRLAVNVSAIQVRQASFVATVEGALTRSGLPPERLELEITEAAMLDNSAETLGILSRLRTLGVRLAMDDFGTGYSSLSTLQRFRFDKIKVDRSFIRHVGQDARAVALLRAVIALGSALDATTNAEGVEDEGQLSMLQAEGCAEAQGYLFGRPMSAADFQARVGQQAARAA